MKRPRIRWQYVVEQPQPMVLGTKSEMHLSVGDQWLDTGGDVWEIIGIMKRSSQACDEHFSPLVEIRQRSAPFLTMTHCAACIVDEITAAIEASGHTVAAHVLDQTRH